MSKSKVLFHVGNFPACNEMFVIIDEMIRTTNADIFVLVENKKISKHIAENFSGRNINLIDYYKSTKKLKYDVDALAKVGNKKQWVSRLKEMLYALPVFDFYKQKKLSNLIQNRIHQCRNIVEDIQPICLVVRGDRHLGNYWEAALLKVCGELKIKRLIVPIAVSTKGSCINMRRYNKKLHVKKGSRTSKTFLAQSTYDFKTKKTLLYKEAFILRALKQHGVLSANPWVMGGGNVDEVLVTGTFSRDLHIQDGCPHTKIAITGHGSHDGLFNIYKNHDELKIFFYEKYNFDIDKKLIMVALPQLAEHKITTWEKHWKEIRFICEVLKNIDANVLISLHPRVQLESYLFVNKEYGFSIIEERLLNVLPVVDLYICTFSSTLEWSVLSGIPTVVIDFYGFDYEEYNSIKSLLVVLDKVFFLKLLDRLICDEKYYKYIKSLTISDSKKFGVFDGYSCKRIIERIIS